MFRSMDQLLTIFLVFALLWAAGSIIRVLYMLLYWRPVGALLLDHDYPEMQRAHDATLWRARDSDYKRKTNVRIKFSDETGKSIAVDHVIDVQLGRSPGTIIRLWHKLGDAETITIYGPLTWIIGGTLPLLFILSIIYR